MEIKKAPLFYFYIYLSLLFLLTLTVVASVVSLPEAISTTLSLLIAAGKAILVLFFFMKLKSVSPKIKFFAFGTLVWTLILISLISVDYLTRGQIGVLGQ
jgi:cytochrome c oxidase subunit 4